MANLKWNELFKALFLAGFLAVFTVWVCGIVWVGIPALVGFSWLFYDFRKKIETAGRILRKEFSRDYGQIIEAKWQGTVSLAVETRIFYWDKNHGKICSFILVPIFIILAMTITDNFKFPTFNTVFLGILGVFMVWCVSFLCNEFKGKPIFTDREAGKFFLRSLLFLCWRVPKFAIWRGPKWTLKTIILTIRAVHSRELAAVAMYSLGGMGYIIAFPPFGLVPATVFLLAIGCGLFTGAFGVAIHKVLLTASAQAVFAKVESW